LVAINSVGKAVKPAVKVAAVLINPLRLEVRKGFMS